MKILRISAILAVSVAAASFTLLQQPKPWNVPDKAAKTANAVKTNAESVSAGKALWSQHCTSCHGKTGLGDGNKAAQLKTTPPDFTKPAVQSQTDGALFFKISEGRDDMPSFKKKIPEQEDIWNLVNFMRTLKK
jgi:mono/diheme cytochrome c family protein